jgi:hypothetical protein
MTRHKFKMRKSKNQRGTCLRQSNMQAGSSLFDIEAELGLYRICMFTVEGYLTIISIPLINGPNSSPSLSLV